ncbi:GPW/gp25 family protein [Nodularia spumigena]|jgi:phage baseplate assembly protein W|uniref:GPW/gp25 family protein n=1 Tax=Nodularia spumigena TaxID=70799 RepID=UPI002B21D58E|nr:GPW/gp25 family protein [Nodularia spumigena]MEA5559360.1 GPW/gp25 family protein [Nodularia spumigena CH309]
MVYGRQREYLGTGWAFPLQLSLQGGIQLSSEEQKVRESIWIILRTGVGDRVYRPNFGSRLSELAFAPLNTDTLLRIRLYVLEALEVWEPRIIVDEVLTEADPPPDLGKLGMGKIGNQSYCEKQMIIPGVLVFTKSNNRVVIRLKVLMSGCIYRRFGL